MIVVIDNYDSFTYNLVQRLGELGAELKVHRNDKTTIAQIESERPSHIIISPGPCTPREAGISCDVILHFAGKAPILGVCLGHQCVGHAYGAVVARAPRLMHGKTIYAGMSNPFRATRYHSLIVVENTLPDFIEVTARSEQGELMGMRHKRLPIEGVQFHPESFLTDEGPKLLGNFLKMTI